MKSTLSTGNDDSGDVNWALMATTRYCSFKASGVFIQCLGRDTWKEWDLQKL